MNCPSFPCKRLKSLEKRYREKYGVLIYNNMRMIKEEGINVFINNEEKKWKCAACGKTLCMHKENCTNCGETNPFKIKAQT